MNESQSRFLCASSTASAVRNDGSFDCVCGVFEFEFALEGGVALSRDEFDALLFGVKKLSVRFIRECAGVRRGDSDDGENANGRSSPRRPPRNGVSKALGCRGVRSSPFDFDFEFGVAEKSSVRGFVPSLRCGVAKSSIRLRRRGRAGV